MVMIQQAVIPRMRRRGEVATLSTFVPEVRTVRAWKATYPEEGNLQPILLPSMENLLAGVVPLQNRQGIPEGLTVVAPGAEARNTGHGRRRRNRAIEGQAPAGEQQRAHRCSLCGREGHNRRTCPDLIDEED
ncbi:hypothetical protein BJ508DRAFT_419532 [Ascobolus immersus RN42]|uniref:CCHC-type domain-containing protein n=1 Tax=Ascobolus immersus RN42 TaxID=1160509 RepID=A0A3N4HDF9_ASCIM|nr:hypothetical protein BJ508DRAFT_419532 [Ascobolus immersus RN42]